MNFLRLFLRGIAVLPSLIQGIESVYGAKTGDQKKNAALEIVSAAVKMADAVANKTIVNADAFSTGLGLVIDGVVACLNASIWAK
ncbi:hypothetical protein [Terriglobus sp. ADX1]|uniref:hypothetical protein n=1 Tax=Terriglobus sp. ADX1 TaxID=2794063 RepID=UPI002FE5C577